MKPNACAEAWAAANGYIKCGEYQRVRLAGFDLLFIDAAGDELQVEVKEYMSRRLAAGISSHPRRCEHRRLRGSPSRLAARRHS